MSGILLEEQGLKFIFVCFQKYIGTWLYPILGIAGLLYLAFLRKKEGNFLFGWFSLILLLTIYNPFLMNPLIEKLDFEAEFYRFFWLLPINFLLAYVLVDILGKRKGFIKKAALLAAAAILVLAVNRDALDSLTSIHFPENVYKVEDDLLMISEIIHKNSKEEQPKVALPLEYNLQARQYDPSLKLSIERNRMLYYLGNTTSGAFSENNKSYRYQSIIMDVIYSGQNIDPKDLKKALKATRTDYLVAYKANDVHGTIFAAGCLAIGETPNAVIYLTAYGEKHNQ